MQHNRQGPAHNFLDGGQDIQINDERGGVAEAVGVAVGCGRVSLIAQGIAQYLFGKDHILAVCIDMLKLHW